MRLFKHKQKHTDNGNVTLPQQTQDMKIEEVSKDTWTWTEKDTTSYDEGFKAGFEQAQEKAKNKILSILRDTQDDKQLRSILRFVAKNTLCK